MVPPVGCSIPTPPFAPPRVVAWNLGKGPELFAKIGLTRIRDIVVARTVACSSLGINISPKFSFLIESSGVQLYTGQMF